MSGFLGKILSVFDKEDDGDFSILSKPRDPKWPTIAKAHLSKNPECVICGRKEKLRVHHKKPVHLFPDKELDPDNLITLCESGALNCHLTFGHLGHFNSYNPKIDTDAKTWGNKIRKRP